MVGPIAHPENVGHRQTLCLPDGRSAPADPAVTWRTLGTGGLLGYPANLGHRRTLWSPGGHSAPADPVLTQRTFGTSGLLGQPANLGRRGRMSIRRAPPAHPTATRLHHVLGQWRIVSP